MKTILAWVWAGLFDSCFAQAPATWEERADFAKYYHAAGVSGAFVLYDLRADKYLTYQARRLDSAFVPASTYKILNSLIALETGVIADEHEVIPWDGVERSVPEWNQDHNMRSAFRVSAVWFYQVLARRIGAQRMQHYVDTVAYGNRNISGGIDSFWLTGGLRITPRQQIELLTRLYRNELPFSPRTLAIVKDIMILDKTARYTLRGKTGWAGRVGWFVGYVECQGRVYFFANNIDIINAEDQKARVAISKSILRDLGFLPD